ncbi:MAG: transposase [Lachnospiraceae bacterium]|nr:transposase [Lachnospiraceae bacterium]
MKNNLRRNPSAVDKWLEEDGLMLIECWSRDGYTIEDIANKIGVNQKTLYDWRSQYPEIEEALRNGREIIDYKVENALLKSALGYKKKEVKVTTTMRYGKVVETVKEVTESEQAPNVNAIQTWLYNRNKEKWKNMNAKSNMFEDMVEDDTIEVIVRRAGTNENENEEDEVVEEKDIVLRKRSEEEQKEIKKKKKAEEKAKKKKEKQHVEVVEDDDEYNSELDEWPDDWEDNDE